MNTSILAITDDTIASEAEDNHNKQSVVSINSTPNKKRKMPASFFNHRSNPQPDSKPKQIQRTSEEAEPKSYSYGESSKQSPIEDAEGTKKYKFCNDANASPLPPPRKRRRHSRSSRRSRTSSNSVPKRDVKLPKSDLDEI